MSRNSRIKEITMKNITIKANQEAKLRPHDGQFTKSYYTARAYYDFEIRNWTIEEKDHCFTVISPSDDMAELVYHDGKISNCSCEWFIENEVGTCMHIEAIKSQELFNVPVRPVIFVNDQFKLKQKTAGDKAWRTPAVHTYLEVKKHRDIISPNITIDNFNFFAGIKFWDFQESSILSMINSKRSVLALEMGLGKTLCALACHKILNDKVFTITKAKTIIIAPNNLRYQWQSEINRFNLGTTFIVEKGSDLPNYQNEDFLITSYEMLNRQHKFLADHYFDIAVIDEIQKVKNGESATWKTISMVNSEYLFALSGTPLQNSISDIISIINIINPFEMKPEWKFYEEYCVTSRARLLGLKAGKLSDLLGKIGKYIINPKINHSQFSMAKKQEFIVKTHMSEGQIMIHDRYMSMIKPLLARSFQHPLSFADKAKLNTYIYKARLAATDGRLIGLEEKSERFDKIEISIQELIDEGKPVIVFSQWLKTLELLKPYLEENSISYCEFNGKISNKNKKKSLNSFITGKTQVFLTTDSGGVGIDGLQHICHNMIHVEPHWNPKVMDQRNGRIVRTLQKSKYVDIFYFQTESEIEKLMFDATERKNSLFNDVMGK